MVLYGDLNEVQGIIDTKYLSSCKVLYGDFVQKVTTKDKTSIKSLRRYTCKMQEKSSKNIIK